MKAKIRVVFYPNVRLQTIAGWHLKIETSKHDCEDDVAGDRILTGASSTSAALILMVGESYIQRSCSRVNSQFRGFLLLLGP